MIPLHRFPLKNKPDMSAFHAHLTAHREALDLLQGQQAALETWIAWALNCLHKGGTVFWAGNGGSAADAQHLAAELVGRYRLEREGLPSVALTTDTSVLTAVSNDYGFDQLFARQVEALCRPSDLLVLLSTSGNSPNLINATERARAISCKTFALLGKDGGVLKDRVDGYLCVNVPQTAHIQEMHITAGHYFCHALEHQWMATKKDNA